MYRDDQEALRAKNETLETALVAEQKKREAAEAEAKAARAARREAEQALRRADRRAGRKWYQSGLWAAGCAVLVVAIGVQLLVLLPKPKPPATTPAAQVHRVKVELFIMSKCPYAVKALDGLRSALEQVGHRVDLSLDYIGTDTNGQLASLHGESEVRGDMLQLCAMRHYPDPATYMLFIGCLNENYRAMPEGWESCARQARLDRDRIRACFQGEEGKQLLRASFARSAVAEAKGSPTIRIGGSAYNGDRSSQDFVRAICEAMAGPRPAVCDNLPQDVEVRLTVLSDRRCKDCKTASLEDNLRSRFFSHLVVKRLDYSDPEGKRLYHALELKHLPAYLFEPEVERAEKYDSIKRWLTDVGNYKQLRAPASFDPTAEICDNGIDDTGNGVVDCADPTCRDKLICREEIPRKLDVFVMSQCPFAVKAIDALRELPPDLASLVDFDIHYIADRTDQGFMALHGQPEVEENIRQLCAKRYYSARGALNAAPRNRKYLDYIWCRNKNIRSTDWRPCATGGISAEVIARCASGPEGRRLLEQDIKLAKALGIHASPTWLANNRHKFSGITAEAIRTNFCRHNRGLPGCTVKAEQEADPPAEPPAPLFR